MSNSSEADSRESSYLDHETAARTIDPLGFAIITLSDSRTPDTDRSGQFLRDSIEQHAHRVVSYQLVRDDRHFIEAALDRALANPQVQVLVTNGGTGISTRDAAYEVLCQRIEKRLDGFGELFRMLSFQQIGSSAMLSRAIGGTVGRRVLFALPGSTNAVRLGFEQLILPQAGHLIRELHKDLSSEG